MAPKKSSNSVGTKRGGTSSHSKHSVQPARASALKKRPAGQHRFSKQRCAHLINALAGVSELAPAVRKAMEELIGHGLCNNGMPAPYRNATITMVREALAGTEEQLETALAEAKAKVRGAEEDKAAREQALDAAENSLATVKQSIIDAKASLKEVAAIAEAARKDLKSVSAAQKAQAGELQAASSKVRKLQAVEEDIYKPLKDAPEFGAEERKRLKSLRAVGKVFGFHDTLLDTVPGVLKKQLDKRRTFDNFVIGEMESEFLKHFEAMEEEVREHKAHFEQHSAAKEQTAQRLTDAEVRQQAYSKSISDAEAALGPAKAALVAARRHRKAFESDEQKAKVALARAEGQLRSFQRGPLAAFSELIQQDVSVLPELTSPPSAEEAMRATSPGASRPAEAVASASPPPMLLGVEWNGHSKAAASASPPPMQLGGSLMTPGSETLAWMPTEILTP